MGLAARVKLFDAYHKPERHLTKKTAAGGAVTLSSLLLMAFVFVFELRSYLATERVTTTGVDVTRDEMLAINVDVTFTSLPCQTLSLDALDASGKHDQDVCTRRASIDSDARSRRTSRTAKTTTAS